MSGPTEKTTFVFMINCNQLMKQCEISAFTERITNKLHIMRAGSRVISVKLSGTNC
jgi:hypothetical protein